MSLVEDVLRYYAAREPEFDRSAGYLDPASEPLRAPIKTRFQTYFEGRDVLEVACGTGYWTQAIAQSAKSILSVDANPAMVAHARRRLAHLSNVRVELADAYVLAGVEGPFTGACALWWWSHIPRTLTESFLSALHRKLAPGARVLFADELPYEAPSRTFDTDGNGIEERTLSSGQKFQIVKNFPTATEMQQILAGIADDVHFVEYPQERIWNLTYTVARSGPVPLD
jgi:demethylmenaquinone methyltransferase/2-methoxy-6-polyprenyl-1,4-benzoquinol methylase